MHHIGTKEIETDRLLLRRFTKADAQAVYTNYARDDLATKYLTWPSHQDVSVTEALGDITASIPHEFEKIDACEIGYVLSPKLWGQGYMSEAMKAVTKYLLKEAGFNRVIARHDVANPASGKVMQKAGLQFEGIHRQGSLNNSGIIDTAQYAILKEDI
ncbi:GNAT family N-acetyltransferase [Ruoffia sp. FAM 24228]|uniref:GNAT family N-acetyltransferase n=1 Tax=unclassified Ruoffia TaxID=2862149 RepID=UPI003888A7B5